MLVFNLTIHHLWGRVLSKFPGTRVVAHTDDSYIKAISQQAAFDVTENIIQATPTLTHLSGDVDVVSFCPEGFVGIGVLIGTVDFVQNFVPKTCILLYMT